MSTLQKYLPFLENGVFAWNRWREEHPNERPDFQAASLINRYLPHVNFSKCVFYKAYLSNVGLKYANLENASMRKAHLHAVDLQGANLTNADLSETMVEDGDFREVKLNNTKFSLADLRKADFRGATLVSFDFHGANLANANLSRANLSNAKLRDAVLKSAILRDTNLSKANLAHSNLQGANLTNANLEGANLAKANLSGAELHGCNLSGANFSDSILNYVNFSNSVFESAIFDGTILGNSNLNNARGLESCNHYGPSVIDHRTLSKSGKLPINFLRGCGLPDTLIEYLPSLIDNPIQFYSCFISYSSRDQSFAERLHADLQNKGLRCWFAPEDLKIGDRIRPTIDESIRVHDRLLLVLSRYSIASSWVEQEVETALAQERLSQGKKQILFPIRLDNKIMEIESGWPAYVKNTRHIGDFSHWENYPEYKKAMERLVRDLQAKSKKEEQR